MNTKRKYILIASLFGCVLASGQQDKKIKKADDKFEQRSYANAIDSYEKLVADGYSSEEIYKSLGDALYLNANYEESGEWYGKLLELEDANMDMDYMYRYAQTLKSTGRYGESDRWMKIFSAAKSKDVRAINFLKNQDYLDKIKAQSERYKIKNIAINSTASDFAPSFNGEELVFSTARDTGKIIRNIHLWNKKPFLNLYKATVSENGEVSSASKLSKKLNRKTHESSTVFTKDGTTVYFTRNNSENGKFSRDSEGVSRLKLYRASLKNEEWVDIVELPFNDDAYSVAHPTLSPDEKKLYFASDMPGTRGSSDIFWVSIHSDGSYSSPQNMGSTINTEARETFPFVTDSNVLYFASDGHPGLGGLDVYATKLEDRSSLYVVNVGAPINSVQDDFSFIINEETKKGFFASNRQGGMGDDDIYGFTEIKPMDMDCNTLVDGIVKDKDSQKVLGGALVTLYNYKGDLIAETTSESNGDFTLEGDCQDGNYKVVANLDEYKIGNTIFEINDTKDTAGLEIVLEKTIKKASVGTNLIKFLNLSPVYFDLDKSDIRPDAEITINKVAEYLNIFPELNIEVQSHTDAKANDDYNNKLSMRRAKETIKYLISIGVSESRISGKGYGETQLTNDCSTREKCIDTQHQLNRRSEFIVVE